MVHFIIFTVIFPKFCWLKLENRKIITYLKNTEDKIRDL